MIRDHIKCKTCGYDLYALTSQVCPECGAPTADSLRAHFRGPRATFRASALATLIFIGSAIVGFTVGFLLCVPLVILTVPLSIAVAAHAVAHRTPLRRLDPYLAALIGELLLHVLAFVVGASGEHLVLGTLWITVPWALTIYVVRVRRPRRKLRDARLYSQRRRSSTKSGRPSQR